MLLASFLGHGLYIHIIHSQRNKLSAHFIDNSYSLFDHTLYNISNRSGQNKRHQIFQPTFSEMFHNAGLTFVQKRR